MQGQEAEQGTDSTAHNAALWGETGVWLCRQKQMGGEQWRADLLTPIDHPLKLPLISPIYHQKRWISPQLHTRSLLSFSLHCLLLTGGLSQSQWLQARSSSAQRICSTAGPTDCVVSFVFMEAAWEDFSWEPWWACWSLERCWCRYRSGSEDSSPLV